MLEIEIKTLVNLSFLLVIMKSARNTFLWGIYYLRFSNSLYIFVICKVMLTNENHLYNEVIKKKRTKCHKEGE